MVTLKEVNEEICRKIENVELTPTNIGKMLDFDEDIGGIKYHTYICRNKIYNYGLDDEKCNITFEAYINSFKDVCDWGIAGGGACEKPETILKKFNDLNLTFKEVDKMNVKEIYTQMTTEDKTAITKMLFEEENEEIFKKDFDNEDAIHPIYGDHPTTWVTNCQDLDVNIWERGTTFAPCDHAFRIAIKWVVKYNFTECLEYFGCEKVRKAIKRAVPEACIVIVTPKALEEVLVMEVKEKIIKELI